MKRINIVGVWQYFRDQTTFSFPFPEGKCISNYIVPFQEELTDCPSDVCEIQFKIHVIIIIACKQALLGTLVAGQKRKESSQLHFWNLNICIEKVDVKYRLAEMTLVITSLPLIGTCFSMFVYICARFRFVLIGGNLTAQWQGATGELEVEFKLSFLFPPCRQSTLESLLAGYCYHV